MLNSVPLPLAAAVAATRYAHQRVLVSFHFFLFYWLSRRVAAAQ